MLSFDLGLELAFGVEWLDEDEVVDVSTQGMSPPAEKMTIKMASRSVEVEVK